MNPYFLIKIRIQPKEYRKNRKKTALIALQLSDL